MTALTDRILHFLKTHVPAQRLRHITGTCAVAKELAALHGVPPEKAELAALLHDAAKGLSKLEMVEYVRTHGLAVPDVELAIRHNPSLLHGYVAADYAQKLFGITDPEILRAVEHHTVGAPRMSPLEKIIYLSDAVSPDRRYAGVEHLRQLSRHDLDEALLRAMAMKLSYVIEKREWLDPAAVRAWNSLVERPQEIL